MSDTNGTPENLATETGTEKPEAPQATFSPEAGPPPRRRGRPPKNPQAAQDAINASANPASAKKGPGRPKKAKSAEPVDKSRLAKTVQGLHAMAAKITGIPLMQISDDEAGILADGIGAVAEEYDLNFGGKSAAIFSLISAVVIVELPRVAILAAVAKERKKKAPPPQQPATDVPFTETPGQ